MSWRVSQRKNDTNPINRFLYSIVTCMKIFPQSFMRIAPRNPDLVPLGYGHKHIEAERIQPGQPIFSILRHGSGWSLFSLHRFAAQRAVRALGQPPSRGFDFAPLDYRHTFQYFFSMCSIRSASIDTSPSSSSEACFRISTKK